MSKRRCPACKAYLFEAELSEGQCAVCQRRLVSVPASPRISPRCLPEPGPTGHTRPPVWVLLVFGVYVLLAAMLILLPPLAFALAGSFSGSLILGVPAAIIGLLGASLMVISIGKRWELPAAQGSIVVPLIGSATCTALLFGGVSFATHEFYFGNQSSPASEVVGRFLFFGTGLVWLGWAGLFGWLAQSVERNTMNDRMYQCLLAGSVLELLVAIPMHLIVRRRGYCCAGMGTGMGIGVGIIVMLIALGPAVFFLFFRRYKQAYGRRRKQGKLSDRRPENG